MVGLILAIIIFNTIAFKTNTRLSKNEIAHLWCFTIALQVSFDLFIDVKYHAYWYFDQNISWKSALPHIILIPPVNMMFINWFPFKRRFNRKIQYVFIWVIGILLYELLTFMPEPWGYFNYGWWSIWHSALVDPVLLTLLIQYYKAFIKTKEHLTYS